MMIPIWLIITLMVLFTVVFYRVTLPIFLFVCGILDIPLNAIPRIISFIWNCFLDICCRGPEALALLPFGLVGYFLGCLLQAFGLFYLFKAYPVIPMGFQIGLFFLPLLLKPLSSAAKIFVKFPSGWYNYDCGGEL